MLQAQNFDLTKPPVGQRRCPKCGLPMFLSQIEPTETLHEDQRTFECVQCESVQSVPSREALTRTPRRSGSPAACRLALSSNLKIESAIFFFPPITGAAANIRKKSVAHRRASVLAVDCVSAFTAAPPPPSHPA
jgi:hypothetical protein